MVTSDRQFGPFAEQRLPGNIESNRRNRKDRLAAQKEGYSALPLSRNIPLNDVVDPVESSINREIAGRNYQVVDSQGVPVIRAYSPRPEISSSVAVPLGLIEERPSVPTSQVVLPKPGRPVSLYSGQTTPRLVLPAQLADIDSLSGSDASQRSQLFDLAKELRITGTALGDSRNDFLGLKNEIKAALISRYPERYATNQTFYRNRLPVDAIDPAEAQALVSRRIDSGLLGLEFRPLDSSDIQDRYFMNLTTGRMRQSPEAAQRVFGYLEGQSSQIQDKMSRLQYEINFLENQTKVPERVKRAEYNELQRRQAILQANTKLVNRMYRYPSVLPIDSGIGEITSGR